ncbi:hypothetical protein HDU93_009029 [Gonapodya sp. JEL0774]|nr:hypothetical protein HDU93_009029 [Gonapodya sp. JEL0774]
MPTPGKATPTKRASSVLRDDYILESAGKRRRTSVGPRSILKSPSRTVTDEDIEAAFAAQQSPVTKVPTPRKVEFGKDRNDTEPRLYRNAASRKSINSRRVSFASTAHLRVFNKDETFVKSENTLQRAELDEPDINFEIEEQQLGGAVAFQIPNISSVRRTSETFGLRFDVPGSKDDVNISVSSDTSSNKSIDVPVKGSPLSQSNQRRRSLLEAENQPESSIVADASPDFEFTHFPGIPFVGSEVTRKVKYEARPTVNAQFSSQQLDSDDGFGDSFDEADFSMVSAVGEIKELGPRMSLRSRRSSGASRRSSIAIGTKSRRGSGVSSESKETSRKDVLSALVEAVSPTNNKSSPGKSGIDHREVKQTVSDSPFVVHVAEKPTARSKFRVSQLFIGADKENMPLSDQEGDLPLCEGDLASPQSPEFSFRAGIESPFVVREDSRSPTPDPFGTENDENMTVDLTVGVGRLVGTAGANIVFDSGEIESNSVANRNASQSLDRKNIFSYGSGAVTPKLLSFKQVEEDHALSPASNYAADFDDQQDTASSLSSLEDDTFHGKTTTAALRVSEVFPTPRADTVSPVTLGRMESVFLPSNFVFRDVNPKILEVDMLTDEMPAPDSPNDSFSSDLVIAPPSTLSLDSFMKICNISFGGQSTSLIPDVPTVLSPAAAFELKADTLQAVFIGSNEVCLLHNSREFESNLSLLETTVLDFNKRATEEMPLVILDYFNAPADEQASFRTKIERMKILQSMCYETFRQKYLQEFNASVITYLTPNLQLLREELNLISEKRRLMTGQIPSFVAEKDRLSLAFEKLRQCTTELAPSYEAERLSLAKRDMEARSKPDVLRERKKVLLAQLEAAKKEGHQLSTEHSTLVTQISDAKEKMVAKKVLTVREFTGLQEDHRVFVAATSWAPLRVCASNLALRYDDAVTLSFSRMLSEEKFTANVDLVNSMKSIKAAWNNRKALDIQKLEGTLRNVVAKWDKGVRFDEISKVSAMAFLSMGSNTELNTL